MLVHYSLSHSTKDVISKLSFRLNFYIEDGLCFSLNHKIDEVFNVVCQMSYFLYDFKDMLRTLLFWVICLNVKPDKSIHLDNVTGKYLYFVRRIILEMNNCKTHFVHVNHQERLRGPGCLTARSGVQCPVWIALTMSRRHF